MRRTAEMDLKWARRRDKMALLMLANSFGSVCGSEVSSPAKMHNDIIH